MKSEQLNKENNFKNVFIKGGESKFVSWEVVIPVWIENVNYEISAIWNSVDNSDSISWKIEIKKSPTLINNVINSLVIPEFDEQAWVSELNIKIPENTDLDKSYVEVSFSNNKLVWIDKIVWSLAKYPYWCVEQTVSSTLPNAILLKYYWLFSGIIWDKDKVKNNLEAWIDKIWKLQLRSWWFAYWEGWVEEANIRLNSFILSSLVEINNVYKSEKLDSMIEKSVNYLSNKFNGWN